MHHGGDDFAALFHEHRIADADVLALDFILVVQGGAGDGGAGELHGLQLGHGGKHTGAAHLDGDAQQACFFLLRQVFERCGPAGGSGGAAQGIAQHKIIQFDDGAIGAIAQLTAQYIHLLHRGAYLL